MSIEVGGRVTSTERERYTSTETDEVEGIRITVTLEDVSHELPAEDLYGRALLEAQRLGRVQAAGVRLVRLVVDRYRGGHPATSRARPPINPLTANVTGASFTVEGSVDSGGWGGSSLPEPRSLD